MTGTLMRQARSRPRLRRRATLATVAAALAVALLLALATQLQAHGALRRALPGAGHRVPAPRLLWLEFTEAVELSGTAISLTDFAGTAIPLGPPAHPGDSSRVIMVPIAGAMRPGRYGVRWQIIGRDGHPVRGRYAFEVIPEPAGAVGPAGPSRISAAGATSGAPGGPPRQQSAPDSLATRNPASAPATGDARARDGVVLDPRHELPVGSFDADSGAYVALRWLSYVMLVAGIGAVVMARVADRAATIGSRHVVQTRLAAIGLAAAWLGVALALARLLAQSWAVHGADRAMSPTLIGPLIATSTWGRAWTLQLAGAIVAAAGFTLALHDARRRGGWRIAQLAALVAAAGSAIGGHAAAAEGWRAPVLMVADFLHVLAAGAWVGGAMMLAVAVLTRAAAPAAANVVRAFSPWALTGAATLALTGVLAAWAHLAAPLAPWTSHYGRVLLLKLGLVGVMVLLGAVNWRRLGPASGTATGNATLRRAVWLEVLMALGVLAVTAALVAIDPGQP